MKNPDLTLRDRLEILDYFVSRRMARPCRAAFHEPFRGGSCPGLAERFAHERRARSQWVAAIQARFPEGEM